MDERVFEGKFGLEKENLRVTLDGRLALTPHPFDGDPHISKDFCESQTEMITEVCDSTEELYKAIVRLNKQVSDEIAKRGEYYDSEDGRYKKITIIPEMRDIDYLRTFKFEDLTYRGTIEFRSCCTQPIADSMTVGAFHLGLQKRLDQLEVLLEPLYDRIARRSCPGLDMMRRLADGESMESLIKDYGTLNRD